MKRTKMLVTVLAVGLIFAVSGCSKNKPVEQVDEVSAPAAVEDSADGAAAAGQEIASVDASSLDAQKAKFENVNINFDFDKFNLSSDARAILADKASFLNANGNLKVKIEGHCDERGTSEYNLALGERRAKAAQDYLIFLGIGADRLSIISYGEEKPLDPAKTEEAFAKNRRDQFRIAE
ncbi:MAG: Peptidoglycan-associated lipoprotein precursor [Deltaproteobacteria bacterium ADurb.Bin510]|nr:MAG: Peptidoglycan-associated lipoprotein precursor [Deltaproteobacteria bacterium ADurb.Bin510]